jgi:hypothetical protein
MTPSTQRSRSHFVSRPSPPISHLPCLAFRVLFSYPRNIQGKFLSKLYSILDYHSTTTWVTPHA